MKILPGFFAMTIVFFIFIGCVETSPAKGADTAPGRALFIPPLLQPDSKNEAGTHYTINVQSGESEFIPGSMTKTIGYNGNFLGPTIRMAAGETVSFAVHNSLAEKTTLHWHGMRLPSEMDGGPLPMHVIDAGKTWLPHFTVKQQAATLWYHPHFAGTTAEQVYRGLAGIVIIEDEASAALSLPKKYGINDIPLIVQERRFLKDGTFSYSPAQPDIMHGYYGNALLTNGMIKPVFTVKESLTRFRLLNGSNSSVLRFYFEDQTEFYQIASDGGFLRKPVKRQELVLSPGERAEILVDILKEEVRGNNKNLIADVYSGNKYTALVIDTGEMKISRSSIPKTLVSLFPPKQSKNMNTRRFVLSTMSMGMGVSGTLTINNKKMDMNRVDEYIPVNTPEVWEIVNDTRGMGMMNIPHSFHIHDTQFLVLAVNGEPPPGQLAGYKDTILLWPGDAFRILVQFDEYLGKYMYHCHLLEHEDQGMMGIFEVIASGK
ncbi:MAG: multicopper oxidase domain-containing protein [Spirochaetales bacterium]|nr:multicopper oxidase domain-containing protein [Spirochaetales bacterium]